MTSDGVSVSNACFDASLLERTDPFCRTQRAYLAKVPDGYVPSFVDLKGTHSQTELEQDKFETLINLALERMDVDATGTESAHQ
jgi:hypothetical protein